MKLDSEQVLCHSNIGHKSDSKPYSFRADSKSFENKEKPLDFNVLNTEGFAKDGENGGIHVVKGNDGDSDPLQYLDKTRENHPASKLDSSVSVDDFVNGNETEVGDFITPNFHPSKKVDSFQESVFYLDKSVMECELPELLVCYKESTCHVVKDICIDEGVLTQDKFLFDSGMDEDGNCSFLPTGKDQDSELMKEKLEIDISMEDVTVSPQKNQVGKDIENECGFNKKLDNEACVQDNPLNLEENESNKGILNQSDSKDLKGDASEMITDDESKELFTLGELLSMPELRTVKSISDDCITDGIEQQPFRNSSKKELLVALPFVSAVEKSNNGNEDAIISATALASEGGGSDCGNREAIISPAQACSSQESTGSSLVNEVFDDSKQENRSITSDFDSSAPTSSKRESDHHLDNEPIETGTAAKFENTADQHVTDNFSSSIVDEGSNDSKQENRSITFDFNSSAPTSSKGESHHHLGHEPIETGNIPKVENTADQHFTDSFHHGNAETIFYAAGPVTGLIGNAAKVENTADQHFTDGFHRGNGETSFSTSGPVTGLITYSGPIAYSGSLSLRSDSSTTSTRSFAFPILQSEWNSSPVRMAKADRRLYRKHRGWRQGLLCCRF